MFDAISSKIDEILSINPSANIFIFEEFIHHKEWLSDSCRTDRPVKTTLFRRILNCDSNSPALLDLVIPSDSSICSTVAFQLLGNFNHVFVSVSIDFLSNSLWDVPLHCTAYDYSHVNWHDLHDHSTDSPWEDILRVGASVAAAEFYGLVQVRIDVCIPQHKYLIS